jgi:hypothetical protein
VQEYVRGTPAFCLDIAPSDVVEDAYLLSLASTAFVRPDTIPEVPANGIAPLPTLDDPGPVGVPPFQYERCLRPGHELATAFAAAREGGYGAFHQAAAERAGTSEGWARSLAELQARGCLRTSLPAEPLRHEPVLPTLQQELVECARAVGKTFVHALRIGFGLWGRWERA